MNTPTWLQGWHLDAAIILFELLFITIACTIINVIIGLLFDRVHLFDFLKRHKKESSLIKKRLQKFFSLLTFCSGAFICFYNGYLIYKRTDLLAHTKGLLRQISPEFWRGLGAGFFKVIIIVYAAKILIQLLEKGLFHLMRKAKTWEQIKANDESIEDVFQTFNQIQKSGVWLGIIIFSLFVLHAPEAGINTLVVILKIYLIISIGLLFVKASTAIIESVDALSKKYSHKNDLLVMIYERLRNLIPLLRRCLEYIIYIIVATLVSLQINFIAKYAEWGPRVIQTISIFFLCRVIVEVTNLIVDKYLLPTEGISDTELQRRKTLNPLIKSLLKYIAFFVSFVLILAALNLNPTPILAGAGILGVVVGLGAQPLINDLVSGFFIIFEHLFLVDDYIETGSARGTVEAIDIRTTRIRDPDGQQHILRNGQLGDITNYSKKYTYAVVIVGVAYDSDLDKVYQILSDIGETLKKQNKDVLDPTQVSGLDNFGESELTIRTITKVKPGKHLQVARDLRKMIKEAFDREDIEIPFARRVLIFKNESDKQFS
ncbi:MAG: mechanosensitive ion channel family protein [Candidatus Omnitrophica bacterium]|nr:mechanosensitive ion channel family protein [Candidatus Omnitrophota bacterium]